MVYSPYAPYGATTHGTAKASDYRPSSRSPGYGLSAGPLSREPTLDARS